MRNTISILFIIIGNILFAQLDNNPPSLKWHQIRSSHFKVIFPDSFEHEAQRVANTLQTLYKPVSKTLGKHPRTISIVLQNQHVIPNGFVTLGPRRSEFFTMSPQNYNFLGTNEWLNLLAVHEFRHVVQYDKSLVGLNKVLFYLFGEYTQNVFSFLSAPLWFWEGDAVGIETALSHSGRGRIPFFIAAYKVNLLEKSKPYSYNKQYLGSFKDFVPNHYVLGYLLTTYVRNQNHAMIWADIMKRAYRIPFTMSPSMRKETGDNLFKTYHSMNGFLDSMWTQQVDSIDIKYTTLLSTPTKRVYTNYYYPQELSDGSIIALKGGLAHFSQFVRVDTSGNEGKVFTPGVLNNTGMLSVVDDKIVWNEFEYDPRWPLKTYSVIKLYDIKKDKKRRITKKTRFAGASLSPDASHIVTIHTDASNKHYIVVLNVSDGKEHRRFLNPDNNFYSMARWADKGNIVLLKHHQNGKKIVIKNTNNGEETDITRYSHENIGHPVVYKDWVLYNSPLNGIDNIYAINKTTKKRYQVTKTKYGAYNPCVSQDSKFIIFNQLEVNGMSLVKVSFDTSLWVPINNVIDRNTNFYKKLVEQEDNENILDSISQKKYSVSRYHKLKGILRPVAWGPMFSSDNNDLTVGVSFRDILSTAVISAGYQFSANEQRGKWFGEFSYQEWFPIVDFYGSIAQRSSKVTTPDTTFLYDWREYYARVGLRVPLNFTRSKFYEHLTLGSNLIFIKSVENDPVISFNEDGELNAIRYQISYSRLLKRSRRDIASRWGQSLFFYYIHTPFKKLQGKLFAAQGQLYFPGIGRHHSLRLRSAWLWQREDQYLFSAPISYPRGHLYTAFRKFYTILVDYRFPLFYPDLNLGPVAYIQRVRANFFGDYGYGTTSNIDQNIYSAGIELSIDFNVFRLIPLLNMGVRCSFLPELNDYSVELLIGSIGF